MLAQYSNPYSGLTFFEFLFELLMRCWGFLFGSLSISNMASDEIQIIVLLGISLSSALVGSFLVLRKMTMLANSLSHTILLGIVGVYLLTHYGVMESSHEHEDIIPINSLLIAALAMGLITTFLTEFLTKSARLQEDASTGIVFTSLFALGVILLTLFTRNVHIGTEVVMGNVDALHLDDCKLAFIILGINAGLIFLFFKEFSITTFDPGLSKALGISSTFFNYLLMIQVSATCIGAFRAVGVLMVLAFMTGPALIARMLTDNLKTLLFLAMGLGGAASIVGVALSRHFLSIYGLALSTAGIVVCTIIALFLLILLLRFVIQRRRFNATLSTTK